MMTLSPLKYLKLCFTSNLQQIYVGIITHLPKHKSLKYQINIVYTAVGKGETLSAIFIISKHNDFAPLCYAAKSG